jgi:TP901 family phage tail tape measure protein
MANLNAGSAVVKVEPDASNFGKNLSRQVTDELDGAGRQINSKLNRSLDSAASGLKSFGSTATRAMTVPIVAGATLIARQVMSYDQSVRAAVTLAQESSKEVNDQLETQVRATIDATRKAWAVGGQEAAGAYFAGVSGGLGDVGSKEMADALDNAGQLAVAGQTTIDKSMTLLVRAAQTFKAENLSAAEASDIYVAAANASLLSLDEIAPAFTAAGSAAAAAGVPLAQMTAAMSTLSMSMELGTASAGLNGIFAELDREGTKLNDTLGQMGHETLGSAMEEFGSFQHVLEAMYQHAGASEVAFKNLFSQTQAGAAAMGLVGENSAGALATLNDVVEGSGSAACAAQTMTETAAFEIQRAWADLMTDMEPVIRDLLPQVLEIVREVMPHVKTVIEALGKLSDATGGWGIIALAAIGPVAGTLASLLTIIGKVTAGLGALGAAKGAAAAGMAVKGGAGLGPAGAVIAGGAAGYGIGSAIENRWGWGTGAGNWFADTIGMASGGTVHPDGRVERMGRLIHVAEGGEREHIVPESKADAWAANRGGSSGPVTINAPITIQASGPVDAAAVARLAPAIAAHLDRQTRQTTARRRD